jgi:hypothetical protein
MRVLPGGVVLLAAIGVITYLAFGSGSRTEEEPATSTADLAVPWVDPDGQSPIVGSVDVNPADDSLWLSTNTGLFRVAANGARPEQVTGQLTTDSGSGNVSDQLIIRFRGPDDMIGSGHPRAGEGAAPRARHDRLRRRRHEMVRARRGGTRTSTRSRPPATSSSQAATVRPSSA